MEYSTESGSRIVLGDRIGSGGQAEVFMLPNSMAAKIYRPGRIPPEEKLSEMLSRPPEDITRKTRNHVSIAWMTDLLYDDNRRIAGYTMPLIDGSEVIINYYNPAYRRHHHPHGTWQFLHRASLNLASAVWAIHEKGYVIGDINESNILVNKKAMVSIIDTDSFQVTASNGRIYCCPVGKEEYTPPEIQGVNFREIDRNEYHDRFGLSVLIYLMLMGGSHPFRGKGGPIEPGERIKQGLFPYSMKGKPASNPAPHTVHLGVLHPGLQELFCRCFDGGHKDPHQRPSAKDWRKALDTAEKEMAVCNVNMRHYYMRNQESCTWCEWKAKAHFDMYPDRKPGDIANVKTSPPTMQQPSGPATNSDDWTGLIIIIAIVVFIALIAIGIIFSESSPIQSEAVQPSTEAAPAAPAPAPDAAPAPEAPAAPEPEVAPAAPAPAG